MVVSYAQDFVIGIYTSPDLKSWTHASNFSHYGLLGLQYECPNLVSMAMEGSNSSIHLMAISISPGAPLGGSITQYFTVSFNGTHFDAIDGAPPGQLILAKTITLANSSTACPIPRIRCSSHGPVIGNTVSWFLLAHLNSGWRSSMSFLRRTRLANVTRIGYDLFSTPYDLSPVYACEVVSNGSFGNGNLSIDYSAIPSGALYFRFKFSVSSIPTDGTAQRTLNFTFSASSTNESVSWGLFLFRGCAILA